MKKQPIVQIEHLQRKHRTLDAELGELISHPHLTPEEYQLARELKKRKLRAKDGITALRQQFTDP
jgi:hypothetical protein